MANAGNGHCLILDTPHASNNSSLPGMSQCFLLENPTASAIAFTVHLDDTQLLRANVDAYTTLTIYIRKGWQTIRYSGTGGFVTVILA